MTTVVLVVVAMALPGRAPAASVDDHFAGLQSQDWRIRQHACDALGESGACSSEVVSALADSLHDHDSLVRHAAAGALAKLGKAAEPAIPDLIPLLCEDYVGAAAQAALREIGSPAVMPLTETVCDWDQPEPLGVAALKALATFGPEARQAAPRLATLLDDPRLSPEFTTALCYALGQMGADARPAIPSLLQLLQSPHSLLRLEAARTLGKLGPLPRSDLAGLVEALRKEEERLIRISDGLARADGTAPHDEQQVRGDDEVADDEHRCVRVQMELVLSLRKLQALVPWRHACGLILPAFIEVLRQPHPLALARRWHDMHHGTFCPICCTYIDAARGLEFYGPTARKALPLLQRLMQHERVRFDLKIVMEAIDPALYLDPHVLPATDGPAHTTVVARKEEFVSDDHRHVILVLRIRHNTLSRKALAGIFTNAVKGKGWVNIGREVEGWGTPEDQPIAEVVNWVPAYQRGDEWMAPIALPKIGHCELYLWDTTWEDGSGNLRELPFRWLTETTHSPHR